MMQGRCHLEERVDELQVDDWYEVAVEAEVERCGSEGNGRSVRRSGPVGSSWELVAGKVIAGRQRGSVKTGAGFLMSVRW